MASLPVGRSNNGCAECAINKAGKLSCCARGGAWFKKCGDAGDTQFDHTWAEGIRACKDFETSVSVESVILHHMEVIAHPLETKRSRNTTRQQTNVYRAGSTPSTGAMDAEGCVGLSKVTVFICVSFVCHYVIADMSLFH